MSHVYVELSSIEYFSIKIHWVFFTLHTIDLLCFVCLRRSLNILRTKHQSYPNIYIQMCVSVMSRPQWQAVTLHISWTMSIWGINFLVECHNEHEPPCVNANDYDIFWWKSDANDHELTHRLWYNIAETNNSIC